jgi:hypothetical protein
MRPLRVSILAIALCLGAAAAQAAGTVPINPLTQCEDGGLPYRVGSHLCGAEHLVLICLRPDQTYGPNGIYVPKGVPGFDKAHWEETTSPQCRKGDTGKVYFSSDPRR